MRRILSKRTPSPIMISFSSIVIASLSSAGARSPPDECSYIVSVHGGDMHRVRAAVRLLELVAVVAEGIGVEVLIEAELVELLQADALAVPPAAAGADLVDDAGVAADRVPVHRVVDRAVADAALLHIPDHRLKGVEVLEGVAV